MSAEGARQMEALFGVGRRGSFKGMEKLETHSVRQYHGWGSG